MSDNREPIDQAERLRRLQERRAASSRRPSTTSPTTEGRDTTAGPRPAARRRHPAKASRIFLAGLSVASFFGIGGSMLLAGNNTASVATPTVAAVQPSTNATAAPTTAKTAATSTKSTAAPVAHTKTKGS
jgi:hypothetical protein